MKSAEKLAKKTGAARGISFPGVKGKVVQKVETSVEEGGLSIHVEFKDRTALAVRLCSQLVIEQATLSGWKTGNELIQRTYVKAQTQKK